MKIIRPVTVDETRLVTSNVAESEYPIYSSGASYAKGDRCYVPANHTVYEAAVAVSGVDPVDDVATAKTPKWLRVGATNRWAMFDGKIGTGTTAAEPWAVGDGVGIQVEVQPGAVINGVAFFGLVADAVTVEVIDDYEGTVYSRRRSLISSAGIDSWYSWFFEPIERDTDLVLDDLPSYGSATLRISIDREGAPATCGLVVIGAQRKIGHLKWGAQPGITDYSRKGRDVFGRPEIVPRGFSKILSADVDIDTQRVDAVLKMLAGYRSTALVWIGAIQYSSTILYGYFRDFTPVLDNRIFSEISIDIEGLNE
ncbi:hypothetical protein [Modicisalibacter coralii]|uniref:hypothetical protein n=1 Tax=Modicisalibacter coralii TaxID=2304602 RepID=UPI00100C16DE|nr:hypothetical protein [Halomonas coralii]